MNGISVLSLEQRTVLLKAKKRRPVLTMPNMITPAMKHMANAVMRCCHVREKQAETSEAREEAVVLDFVSFCSRK